MVDDTMSADGSAGSVCPWCSAAYRAEPDTCPSCGAALAVDPNADPALPGLTAIDAAAIARSKVPASRSRNRLLSWISGDYPDDVGTAADVGALAPPPLEVRQEKLRLALQAEVASLQAEVDSFASEAAAEGRYPAAAPMEPAAADATPPAEPAKPTSTAPDMPTDVETDPAADHGADPA
jgi:hypothetical protein